MNNDVIIVQLDRPRQIKFSHTALKTLVSMAGKNIEELDEEMRPGNFEMMELVFYCGLLFDAKQNGETLSREQAVELLDSTPVYVDVLKAIFDAWKVAFGANQAEGNDQPEKGPANEKPTTGKKASA